MPRGDRGKGNPPLGWTLPVIGVVLVVFLSWGVGWLQASEKEKRQQTPAAYQDRAKKNAQRTCIGIEPSTVFECVYEHIETAKQTAHDEQDLSAQQRAASSALASAAIAFFTLIITGVGVWFVKRTLEATLEAVEDTGRATEAMNDANEIARMAYNASVRPWLSLDAEMAVDYLSWMEDGNAGLFVDVTARNYGKSPAINVNVLIKVDVADFGGDYGFNYRQFFEDCCEELRITTESSIKGETIFPENSFMDRGGDSITFDKVERSFLRFAAMHRGTGIAEFSAIYPVVFIGCGYNSPYDSETRITAYMANVMQFQHGVGHTILFGRNEYSLDLLLHPKVKGCARLD